MTGKNKHKNICINCYNQHGCMTDESLCLLLKREDAEKYLWKEKACLGTVTNVLISDYA